MTRPTPKPAGTWDFFGSCAPTRSDDGHWIYSSSQLTFTLGCFQWIPMARGKRVKRGPVRYRIHGTTSDPQAAFDAAAAWCARKNAEAAE